MEKRQENLVRISVRSLVEFILRSGDIDNRRNGAMEKDAMQAGSRLHRKIQKEAGAGYRAEVVLKCRIPLEEVILQVEGRADGIIEEGETVIVDEIKGIYGDVLRLEEPYQVHLAQAKCYAYMIATERDLPQITVQMTYGNLDTYELKRFTRVFQKDDLTDWFQWLVHEYGKWAVWLFRHRQMRDESMKGMEFPFPYREGQRDLAVSVYRTISRGKRLFIQAPTGIGKTMSAIFPAVKAMGEGYGDKIFYLTAKTVTRTVAEEAFDLLREKGLKFLSVTITAKEKLCMKEKPECNPQACPYAKGHYDRINDAVFDLIEKGGQLGRERIFAQAESFFVCPFELCLDLTDWADGIIGDYNYVFDPNVCLKRYFADGVKGEYVFLIDEAHNLVERAREMYSASLTKESFLEVRRLIKDHSKALEKKLRRCNQILLEYKKECETWKILESAGSFTMALQSLFFEMQEFAENSTLMDGNETWQDFYFQVRHFLNMSERLDENYRIYIENQKDGGFLIKELCVNPSANLIECLNKGISGVFFSATMLPMPYYRELLTGDPEDYAIYAFSPFSREKRLITISQDVSSRYTRRGPAEYRKVSSYIREMVRARQGKYLVFFPSYAFMKEVYDTIKAESADKPYRILLQDTHMTEEEREEFLDYFLQVDPQPESSLVGFCVIGGIFSEGIDLKGDSLIGVCIVGTGLPQICTEKEVLKQYYEEQGKNGFDYAYRYPGMNRVLQAAGRVIRTAQDEGVIVLLDDRFLQEESQILFPREWSDCRYSNQRTFFSQLETFWKDREEKHEK